jgi:hypothetical protein
MDRRGLRADRSGERLHHHAFERALPKLPAEQAPQEIRLGGGRPREKLDEGGATCGL